MLGVAPVSYNNVRVDTTNHTICTKVSIFSLYIILYYIILMLELVLYRQIALKRLDRNVESNFESAHLIRVKFRGRFCIVLNQLRT
jgi:hypothetical protein